MTEELPGRVTDARALRALSHPLRWKLIDTLALLETATATRCAELTGESVASCAYHLGILAKYGFVEPVPDSPGREKPWRMAMGRLYLNDADMEPEAQIATEAVSDTHLDHMVARMKESFRRSEPEPWRGVSGTSGRILHVTVEELTELTNRLEELTGSYDNRRDPAARPAGTRPVRLMVATYLPLPAGTTDDGTATGSAPSTPDSDTAEEQP